jgi:hypothetical protein
MSAAKRGQTRTHGDQRGQSRYFFSDHPSLRQRRHREPADKARTFPNFDFDFASTSEPDRLPDGVGKE